MKVSYITRFPYRLCNPTNIDIYQISNSSISERNVRLNSTYHNDHGNLEISNKRIIIALLGKYLFDRYYFSFF
jgi:poly-gamma-glutamate capsule biosynthesis protein CapA/YwtB (metallophosphatase superfamily)